MNQLFQSIGLWGGVPGETLQVIGIFLGALLLWIVARLVVAFVQGFLKERGRK
jgi:hypothetical protein